MSPDEYLAWLEWLNNAEFTLHTSRLDATHHVSVMLQPLVVFKETWPSRIANLDVGRGEARDRVTNA
jgi:hypothetical protein